MLKPYSVAEVQFELGEEIGSEGKNSQVYRANDPQLGAELVIKRMLKTSLSSVDQYFSEATLLYQSSHSNIVPIHYACQDSDSIFLAMPYYSNGSLKSRMNDGFLTVRDIVKYATQVLSGLQNIHSKRLIHFDVKPDNILISDRGEALISDFGLAKQTSFGGVAQQDRIYNKMVPPEAFRTDTFTSQFDIYQMGLTLHRMCVGDSSFYSNFQNYFENGTLNRDSFRHAVVNGHFPDKTGYPEHIPARLVTCIAGCLKNSLAERLKSAVDVINEFAAIDGKLLDWQYEVSGGVRAWTKSVQEATIRLQVNDDLSSEAIKFSATGNSRRIVKYCKSIITRTEIKKFLRDN